MAGKPVKPGQTVPDSGQYKPVGPRGGNVGGGEVTLVKGKTAPPTQQPGQKYIPVDLTKHKPK